MEFEFPAPLALAIIVFVCYILWFVYSRRIGRINRMPDIPRHLPPEGFEVPVLATFTGLKRLPRRAALSHNNINPSLTLFEDRIECRVLRKDAVPLGEIRKVDIWDAFATRNLHVYARGREGIFTANLLSRKNLRQVLRYMERRGVILTPGARAFMNDTGT